MISPPGGLPEHFDAIVVGSGFGGSVTAYRLAAAGQRVLVLERGKPYPPGSFPRTPVNMKNNFWNPSQGLQGMFDLWSFDGFDGLVSSGLGGGSLIYANVTLRKDEHWFVHDDRTGGAYESWPVTRADLDPHYDRVEPMLEVQKYPFEQAPYNQTGKTIALQEASAGIGEWFLPNLAITFANPNSPAIPGEPIMEARPNLHHRTRQTCRLCGECDVGCNYGSKNTLDYTYLTAAQYDGAEIRTRCEVRDFAPLEGGRWTVSYVHHDANAEGRVTDTKALPSTTLTTDRLILSAGTFGTNFLLMSMRERGVLPGLSPALGQGFSGNGDMLSFALRCSLTAPDGSQSPRIVDPSTGPVITSAMRIADEHDGAGAHGRGFYVEDAGYPAFGSWMVQLLDEPRVLMESLPLIFKIVRRLLGRRSEDDNSPISELFGDCSRSAGLMPLLAMGRDVPDGRMSLEGDTLQIDWSKDGGSRGYYDRVREVCEQMTKQAGGKFRDVPTWLLNRAVTVHPVGGARMGSTAAEGVVDPWGRVFGYPGLHVADGSVMPGPVGANPSLTIAALADRFADAILAEPR
jgi:cholesterol oxidase